MPGTDVPIHRHPDKDESFVILCGKVRSTTYNDDGSVIDSVILSQDDGIYGVDIPQCVWHKLESLAPASVIFECKAGPYSNANDNENEKHIFLSLDSSELKR